MKATLNKITQAVRNAFTRSNSLAAEAADAPSPIRGALSQHGKTLIVLGALGLVGFAVVKNPPISAVKSGEVALRVNQLTGEVTAIQSGSVLSLPPVHQTVKFSLRDELYRPSIKAGSELPQFQSLEGLSFGADLGVRYAISPERVNALANHTPSSLQDSLVKPSIDSVVYKILSRYTVREIYSSKRAEILKAMEAELQPALAKDGLLLRHVHLGQIELPPDYKAGVEQLLAEELANEKMRYTLDLKEKLVKQTGLEAEAEKVRQEKRAEGAAREQVIAAKAQEEAMKHVLPFKQRQIEQRQFEAEAEKVARIKSAEGAAQARRIEAAGEADSRQKLADAEAYRMDKVGKSNAEQMAREGALISRHPLLIQKTMADKLSDKVAVIIAPPGTNGEFIGNNLIGKLQTAQSPAPAVEAAQKEEQ